MQVPHHTTSGETLYADYGHYLLAHLQAEKDLEVMAKAWTQAQERLREHLDAYEAAREAAMTALAVRDHADDELDKQVRSFALAVLQKTDNDHKSDLYRTYFPSGWSPVVTAPLGTELQRVGVILTLLGEEKDPALAACAGPIRAAHEALEAAVKDHKAQLQAEATATALVQSEKINWFDAYRLAHRALSVRFYQDPQRAEAFFKRIPKARKAKATAG